MDAAFDRAGSERSVHAEAFAGRAEQRQEEDRQGVEQQQTVAPLRIADAQDAQAHAETQILGVAEPRLDRPSFGVESARLVHDPQRTNEIGPFERHGRASRQAEPGQLRVCALPSSGARGRKECESTASSASVSNI